MQCRRFDQSIMSHDPWASSGGSNEIADEASESYEDVVIEECIEEEVLTEDEVGVLAYYILIYLDIIL